MGGGRGEGARKLDKLELCHQYIESLNLTTHPLSF